MGLSRKNFNFKEVFILYLAILITINYLYFIKQTGRSDIFDLLFPQMTIAQIKSSLLDNFYIAISFLERIVTRLPLLVCRF